MAVPNVRVDQLRGFIKQYEQSPSSFTLGLDAKTIWEGRGLGNLAKIGKWSLGGKPVEKPTRDFSVQLGSWQEVGDALGVEAADDRIEPVEAALAGLFSSVESHYLGIVKAQTSRARRLRFDWLVSKRRPRRRCGLTWSSCA